MRRVSSVVASVVFASLLLGCPLLKKKGGGDGEPDPTVADAATVTVSGTGAKNEANILRYANEEAVDEVAVIGKDGTKARNFPGNGPEVATLKKGTVVKQMAKYFSTGVLVMFDDPDATDGSKLMGWVTPSSFDVAAPKPVWTPPKVVDAGGIKPTVLDAGHGGGGGGGTASVDAGVAQKDAGSGGTAAVDAGGGGGGTAAVDAGGGGGGGAIPQPKPGTVAVQPINGKCPDNWMVHQSMCRRVCNADGDCPRGTKCKPGSGKKVCTAD